MASLLLKHLNPWRFRQQQMARQLADLRTRDGDNCARCRRPLRFDRPAGHDLSPRIEVLACLGGSAAPLANLCLTHGRCNAQGQDHTEEVNDRLRLTREAELLSKKRAKRRAA